MVDLPSEEARGGTASVPPYSLELFSVKHVFISTDVSYALGLEDIGKRDEPMTERFKV